MLNKQERNGRIAELYKRHGDPKIIMAKFELSHEMVRLILKEQGIILNQHRKSKTEARNNAIIKAYKDGQAISEIAYQFNRTKAFISTVISTAGANPIRKQVAIRNQKILNDIKKGARYPEIAQTYNVSVSTICQIGKRNGVNKREEMKNKIKKMLKEEQSGVRIAKMLGVTQQYVSHIKRNHT